MGVKFLYPIKNGVLKFLCSHKFTNFLKDAIFHVKQFKFMVLTHSKGVLRFFLGGQGGVNMFFACF